MNTIQVAFMQPWAERLGWTLLHFVWQGALIAALLAAVRGLLGRSISANARYRLACLALCAMVAAPLATFAFIARLTPQPAGDFVASPSDAAGGVSAVHAWSWGLPRAQQMLAWLVMAWLGGVVLFSARLMGGWLRAARLRSVQSRPAPPEWQQMLGELMGRIAVGYPARAVRQPVRLLVSALVEAPAVLGWLRPVILIPAGALAGLPAQHLEALLAHELAHIWRRDYLVNLLQSVAEAVLFYHPAVWWVSHQIRVERELCCDDLAVAASGDVVTYARALVELESHRPAHKNMAIAANGGRLAHRIGRLLAQPQPASHLAPGAFAAWTLSILLLAGISAAIVRGAQDSAQTSRPRSAPSAPTSAGASTAPAAPAQEPAVSRDAIWVDTARQGDMPVLVRALGVLATKTAVELNVAESQMRQVRLGQPVSIQLPRSSDVFAGRVTRIRSGVTNGLVTIDVLVEGTLPQWAQPGAPVDGTIQVETVMNVVYIGRPVSGRPNSEGTLFKLEPDGKQAVKVKVLYGRPSVNLIEIRSGLQPGDKVILSDTRSFDEFDRINLK